MARRPYVPSGHSEPGALPALLLASIGAALAAGLVEGFVSQWFDLLLLFPAALGGAVGFAGQKVITARKLRRPVAAAVVMVLAGTVATATVHVVHYYEVRSAVADNVRADAQLAEFVQANGLDQAVDLVFSGEDHLPPFVGYLVIAARQGITLTGHGGSGTLVTGIGVYILWGVDLLLAIGVAVFMAWTQARQPFCEACNTWYQNKDEMLAAGSGAVEILRESIQRLESGQFAEAVRKLGETDGRDATLLLMQSCTTCSTHEPVLEVKYLTGRGTKKEKQKIVWSSLVTPQEARTLRQATQVPPPAEAA